MTTYLLRGIPDAVHQAAKGRLAREGRSLRWLLLTAMAGYGSAGAEAEASRTTVTTTPTDSRSSS